MARASFTSCREAETPINACSRAIIKAVIPYLRQPDHGAHVKGLIEDELYRRNAFSQYYQPIDPPMGLNLEGVALVVISSGIMGALIYAVISYLVAGSC